MISFFKKDEATLAALYLLCRVVQKYLKYIKLYGTCYARNGRQSKMSWPFYQILQRSKMKIIYKYY